MRNRDMPASGHGNHEQGGDPGLTKREAAAIAYGASVRSRCSGLEVGTIQAAHQAVADADALFDELEKGE